MDEITKILQDIQRPDDKIRHTAEGELMQLQESGLTKVLLALSAELASDESTPDCRRLAGIILKNSVDGRRSAHGISQWINLDQTIKSKIKESLLVMLGCSVRDGWHTSSLVIAKVAQIEIPRGEWPDLIGKLLANMEQQGAKQATLEALGYVFEEEILGFDPDQVNAVVNAVVQAMNQAEQSCEVRVAALKALQNVVKSAANLANDDCRSLVMSAICDIVESDEVEMIKQEAFGCLVVIASRCYALREENESFAHAIEKQFSSLVPVLLKTLLNQHGNDTAKLISKSATACLGLIARTIGDAIVPLAMEFVELNMEASDWQSRKAATCALGVILEGPSIEKLVPVVRLSVESMEDPSMEVRGSAVRTLGRVFQLLHPAARANRIFTEAHLHGIVAGLGTCCYDAPQVSEQACRAMYFLAKGYDESEQRPHSEEKMSSELSRFMSDIFDALFDASALAMETPFRLPPSASAYEALSEVVRVSNIQDYKASVAVRVVMLRVMRRLNSVLDARASSSGDKSNRYDLLALLCGLLHVIIHKLGNTPTVTESAPCVLLLFCRVLTCDGPAARDKAALAIGALADATGPNFVDHMPILLQYVNVKLLFPTYLGVIGNMFHVLGERILRYCDDIVGVLLKGLSEPQPPIFECFGVIALAIGKDFGKYLQDVLEKLKEAGNPSYYANVFDEEKVKYVNQLRRGISKAYSGILRGIKDPTSEFMVAMHIHAFAEAVREDLSRGSSVASTAADVLSELGRAVDSWQQRRLISGETKAAVA